MTKQLLFALSFLSSFITFSQEKIPFITYEGIITEASKAIQGNDNEKTIEILNKINKNDSIYASTLITKSYYLIEAEKYEEAIEVANEGLSLNNIDSNLSFYINKGLANVYLKNYEESIKIYDEGLKTYPNYYLLWHNKGAALEGLGKKEEAVKAYQKSIILNPNYAKSHLQLGNICYEQELLAQAFMSYNMYLLLKFDEDSAFNTLKSLNNIVAEKNENEADPDITLSEDDEAFEEIDLVLSNKIALNKNYKTGNKINISLTNQNHALLKQLEDFEGHGGFWDKKYVPFFKWINENNLFDSFIYTLCYSIENEKYKKIIAQNEKEIAAFVEQFYPKWHDILRQNTEVYNGVKQDVTYNYYNSYTDAIGKTENGKSVGPWKFYNENGQLIAYGSYDNNEDREGKWTWLHKNGGVKETAIYKKVQLNGENLHFFENGKPYVIASYLNGKLDGEYKYYNNKGALIQKRHLKSGELDGVYQSYFDVGETLPEFYVPYKDGLVDDIAFEYYTNGNVYAEMPFKNGKREGIEKKFFYNKKISSEINYVNGELNGPYKSYYLNGNIYEIGQSLNNYYNGPWKSYYQDGTLQSDFTYDNGSIDGLYKYFDSDGKLYYEYLYRKGEIIEYKYYDKDGGILSEGRKKGGEFKFVGHHPNGHISSKGLYDIKGGKEGAWEFFSKNGVLSSKGTYTENKVTGEYTDYFKNGKVETSRNYTNDSLSGYYSNYFKNEQLKQQGWHKDDAAHGEWRTYYIDGSLEIINFYHKDKLHGNQEYYSVEGKLGRISKYEYGDLLTETYFDNEGNIISQLDYAPKENNFIIESFYKNKKTNFKIEYVNGVKHGKYLGYDFYGNKSVEGHYINGVQDGKWVWYYENGNIESIRNYLNGNLNGEGIDYYENGTIKAKLNYEYGNAEGTWLRYHENGKLSRSSDYVNDVYHGKRTFYDSSENIQLVRFYNQGTIIGYSYLDKDSKELSMIPIKNETAKIKSFFPNGNIARELEYKNGDLVNDYNVYHISGQVVDKMHFIDDEYNGTELEYYTNGNLKSETNYQMGYLHGLTKKYYQSGKLKEEIMYRNGDKTGEANYYNENGKLTKKEFYFNGEIYNYEAY